jgi:hypothetical protein
MEPAGVWDWSVHTPVNDHLSRKCGDRRPLQTDRLGGSNPSRLIQATRPNADRPVAPVDLDRVFADANENVNVSSRFREPWLPEMLCIADSRVVVRGRHNQRDQDLVDP